MNKIYTVVILMVLLLVSCQQDFTVEQVADSPQSEQQNPQATPTPSANDNVPDVTANGAERFINCNFEEGPSWDYNNHFNLYGSYLEDEWIMTQEGCYDGWCAESSEPSASGWSGQSVFHTSFFGGEQQVQWGDEIFVRFKIRYPIDWEDEALDSSGGSNHIRIGGITPGNWGHGLEYNPGWLHIYDTGVSYNRDVDFYIRDNQWHEEAYYIKIPSAAGVRDGVFAKWIDATEYNLQNALFTYDFQSDIVWQNMLFAHYYKGPVTLAEGALTEGNYKFWVDNIEFWKGIPAN